MLFGVKQLLDPILDRRSTSWSRLALAAITLLGKPFPIFSSSISNTLLLLGKTAAF
jgi:hypothetical protein